jgi:hypothetical protein
MKKAFRMAVFVLIIGITAVTLTSGISKERSGGERNLVDELYSQAVKQNDNLGSIEDDIDKFYKKRNDALEKYNSFISYNNRYYSDAKEKAATIAGAATKQRANDIISKSEAGYTAKLTDWQTTIATLNAGVKELTDLHALLKIMITEPMIGKYQTTAFPDNSKLNEANGDLLKVIEKIKTITK